MTARLVWEGVKIAKARFICAAAGVAAAAFAVIFTTSLAATNAAQAPLLAARAAAPWQAWQTGPKGASIPDLAIETFSLTIDHRPDGRVLQGPPMRAILALAPDGNPYDAFPLAEGRWPDSAAAEPEVVCVRKAMQRFGAAEPPIGSKVKFVGRNVTMSAAIVGYLDGDGRLPPQFPGVFANSAAIDALDGEERGHLALWRSAGSAGADALTPSSPLVVAAYRGDEQRRMDYARPLMFIAAVLTALSLLVNSLLLSVESNRRTLARLRAAGMTRGGVVRFVAAESLFAGAAGWAAGSVLGVAATALFVALNPASFPAGPAFDFRAVAATFAALPALIALSLAFALGPALRVRALDALNAAPRRSRLGMTITFAIGFAAFIAVEVWGSSLMRAFVPSPEWPDAIVSLLPGGASSFDVDKLRGIEGVKRISELLPLQVYLDGRGPDLDGPGRKGGGRPPADGGGGMRKWRPNALFLAAEWLPSFRFKEGSWEDAESALRSGGVVITEMMSRALSLHKGDKLLDLPIAGVVDLNWHMVTSRGLVRGLNRMPPMTTGPVFASFDTVESLDMRPAPMVRMTHLWVEYEEEFLRRHGVFEAGRLVEAEIARRLGNPVEATVRLHARDEIADGTLSHGSNIIGAAARVPFVFLFILAIGFVAMLVAEAESRRCEFAALRAVGATRAQLAVRLASAAIATALAGVAIGLPLGAAAGFLATFKTAAIWPGLPHYFVVPWRFVAEGAAGALAAALVFAVPASLRIVAPLVRRRAR